MKCNDNGQIKYNLKINETKIEQKISTEAELVGADILWTGYLLKAQGCKSFTSVMSQVNKSVVLLEQNGIF